jgi:hypothetical protein
MISYKHLMNILGGITPREEKVLGGKSPQKYRQSKIA